MISCFTAIFIPFNRRYCKSCALRSKQIKLSVSYENRLLICMRHSDEQQNSQQKPVSQGDSGSSPVEKELEDSPRNGEGRETRASFKYIPGAQGTVDVWFIIGLLVLVIPIVAIVWGISTGVIDLSSS
ncbi:hypothetical protein Gasu2_62190 [Galdieria sulphuraria]|nr:hypothetical protein Gasu2_62190 [Galdieria sulphuraria]